MSDKGQHGEWVYALCGEQERGGTDAPPGSVERQKLQVLISSHTQCMVQYVNAVDWYKYVTKNQDSHTKNMGKNENGVDWYKNGKDGTFADIFCVGSMGWKITRQHIGDWHHNLTLVAGSQPLEHYQFLRAQCAYWQEYLTMWQDYLTIDIHQGKAIVFCGAQVDLMQEYTQEFIRSQHAGHPLIPRSQATEHSMAPLALCTFWEKDLAEWKEYSTLNDADQKSGIAFSNAQLQLCRKNVE